MKLVTKGAAALGLFCVAATVGAVSLNPRGTGQVLLYPYYTVNAGQNTLISLVNGTDRAKAVKVRVREAYNGREVGAFNLYLSPYDVWTAAVFTLQDGAAANVLTEDKSCTVPALRDGAALPVLPDGRHYLPLGNLAYSGTVNADSGPVGLDRTREGMIEVIEMGELGGASALAATHVQGTPSNCPALVAAWGSGGYWATNADADLYAPKGGLYGTLAVVNPSEGTIFQVAATALDGFSSYAQHSAPSSAHPDLGDARSSARDVVPPYADADVSVDGSLVHAHYVGADRTVDAVSAVLMSAKILNEYVVSAADGASTDWVVAMPTKRHYTDPALLANAALALPPFVEVFGKNQAGASCSLPGADIFDREEAAPTVLNPGFPGIPPADALRLCTQVNVVSMLAGVTTGAVPPRSGVLASTLARNLPPFASAGHIALELNPVGPYLRADANGLVIKGLPAVGFAAVNYVNHNVAGGVLANYSGAVPHRSTITCAGDAHCQ